jgi:hypothetical protein
VTPLKNALSWFALGAVAVVAACAQGSSATGENEAPVTGDAGVQPLDSNGEDGGSVNQGDNDAGGNGNVSDDAGDPATSDDAGIPSTSDDAGQAPSGDDAGAGAVDAGGSTVLDAGTHSGGTDAGSPSSSVRQDRLLREQHRVLLQRHDDADGEGVHRHEGLRLGHVR